MVEDVRLSERVVDRIEELFNGRRTRSCNYRFSVFAYPDEKVVVFIYKGIECGKEVLGELRSELFWAVEQTVRELGYGWRLERR